MRAGTRARVRVGVGVRARARARVRVRVRVRARVRARVTVLYEQASGAGRPSASRIICVSRLPAAARSPMRSCALSLA